MKKLIFTFALTLALTAGVASPVSVAAQTKQASPQTNPVIVTHDGPTPCPPGMCVV